MSMRVKAALVIMAIVFVFTVASFFLSLSFTQRHMTETIEHELTLALDIADTVVATKIKLLKSNAETMAARINAVSEAEMAETMAALRLEFGEFISLTVYDRTGSIANDGAPIEHDVFHLESQYIDSALHGDTFLTSAHYNNTNTGGDLVIHVFVPMGSDRVLSATIPGMLFSGILSEYRLWQTGSIFMVDAQGAFVASLRSDLVLEQRNLINDAINDPELASAGEFYKAMITSDQGHNSGRYTFEGTERLCVYKHVSGSKVGWYIGVTAPLSESPLQNIQDGLLLSALFFLAAGAIVSIFVSGIVAKPFITIQTQAAAIHEAHEQTTLLLDAMPFACNWWDRSLRLSGCNEGTIRLFQLSGRQEFIDHFYDFSPEYQPDGKLSAEEAVIKLKKAFEEGRCVFEWAHQKRDGTPIPTEVTLIRIAHNNGYVVAGYVRDLREYKQMMNEIDRNTQLLSTMNQVANILLQPESDKFEEKLKLCMGMIGQAVSADRVCIWKNKTKAGKLYCDLVYDWPGGADSLANSDVAMDVSYNEQTPGWEEILSQGKCINTSISRLSPEEQAQLQAHGVKSLFVAPVFVHSEFWGYIGFDDYYHEKVFSDTEASTLYSGSLLIANALVRNEMLQNLRDASIRIEAALTDATRANDAKSRFLANMSHEMRTPLNAIIGLTDLTLGNERLDEESLSNLEKINGAGMSLLSTVNDILDISKIEAEKFELIPAVYDMPSLINDTVTQSIMHKGEKPIQFVLSIDGDLPSQLTGDELRIKQILNNLLSNAFKYTKEGIVEMGIHCIRDGETVWMTVHVRDTGIGIRPEYLSSLFDNYSQMDTKANRKIMGTGLGLSIAKRMVELMNGSISVESEYGKGTIFTARFPQKFVSDATMGPDMAKNLQNFQYYEQKRRLNSKLARISLPYARVLIVDDVVNNLDVAKGLMKPYGMQIDCATSGQQAIDAIRSEKVRYNAVFMDHMMPGMDGIEAMQIIRKIGTEYAETIPIIALTANAVAGNEEMFLNKGFQAFISKPIELIRLDAVIRQWVRDKEQEKQLFDRQIAMDGSAVSDARSGRERRAASDRRSGLDRRHFGKLYYELNVGKGIERFGGDKETYLEVLRSFAVNTRPLLEKVKEVSRESLTDYVISTHGIKGSSRGIFAEEVGDRAAALEKAANAGDFDFVSENNPKFIEAVELLLADLDDTLQKIDEKNPKPKKSEPCPEMLAKILAACRKYDMDGADAAMVELEHYEYASGDELISRLRENVDEANFARIIEELSYLEK